MPMNDLLSRMSPRAKQLCAIALAAAGLVGAILVTMGGRPSGPEERWNPKTDKQVNVITNDNNKNLGLDAMAGRIKHLDNQNKDLKEKVERLIKDREAEKADKTERIRERELKELREWKERFDALSNEVNRLRSGMSMGRNDGGNGSNGTNSKTSNASNLSNPSNPQIDDPFEVREQKRRELLGMNGDSDASSPSTGKGREDRNGRNGKTSVHGSRSSGPLTINVVSDPEASELLDDEVPAVQPAGSSYDSDSAYKAYIPAGSILTGTLITGADFPTGAKSRENPTPTLIRLSKTAILPNRFRSDVRECFMLVSGHGDLATERAALRSEMLSCVRNDGSLIQTRLSGYVAGEDGKAGMKGRLVSKTGQMIARTMVAGFLSGMSEAFDYDPVEVLSTSASNNVEYQSRWSQDLMKGGFAQGATKSLERVADFYMDLADQMTPVVEITAGRQVDLIVIQGTYLDVLAGTKGGELSGFSGFSGKGRTMEPMNSMNSMGSANASN